MRNPITKIKGLSRLVDMNPERNKKETHPQSRSFPNHKLSGQADSVDCCNEVEIPLFGTLRAFLPYQSALPAKISQMN